MRNQKIGRENQKIRNRNQKIRRESRKIVISTHKIMILNIKQVIHTCVRYREFPIYCDLIFDRFLDCMLWYRDTTSNDSLQLFRVRVVEVRIRLFDIIIIFVLLRITSDCCPDFLISCPCHHKYRTDVWSTQIRPDNRHRHWPERTNSAPSC